MEKSGVLIILGNGHNLGMNFRTSYKHFADLYLTHNNYESNDSRLYNYLANLYKDTKWNDLEADIKAFVFTPQASLCDRIIEHNFFEKLRHDIGFYMLGESRFQLLCREDWVINESLNSLSGYIFDYIFRQSYRYDIISFNYTCLEEIAKVYIAKKYGYDRNRAFNDSKINDLVNDMINVNYIHIAKNMCVLGTENDPSIPESFSFIKKINQINKGAYQINLADYKRVLIYGHSLGQSDYDFFSRMFGDVLKNNTEIVIVTLNEPSKKDIVDNLQNIYHIEDCDSHFKISFLLSDDNLNDNKVKLANYLR